MRLFAPVLACAVLATPALADMTAVFTESAPKDRFRIANLSDCATGPIEVTIDLTGSAAGLIFDTTAAGQGVEVFQPFELIEGAEWVRASNMVVDGDARIVLALEDLPGGASVAFTIDVDDTLPQSANGQIMVSGGEISGASVSVTTSAQSRAADFDATARATIPWQSCQA